MLCPLGAHLLPPAGRQRAAKLLAHRPRRRRAPVFSRQHLFRQRQAAPAHAAVGQLLLCFAQHLGDGGMPVLG